MRTQLIVALSATVALSFFAPNLALASPDEVVSAKKAPPAPIDVPNFHGLKIPAGGKAGGPAPGGKGKIVVYRYQAEKAAIDKQLRSLLSAGKWTIKADTKSPRGTVRLEVVRGKHTVKISVTGARGQTALILTR